jgi:hypothetical protein
MDKQTFKRWFWFEDRDHKSRIGYMLLSIIFMILTLIIATGALMSVVLAFVTGIWGLAFLAPVLAYLTMLSSRVANHFIDEEMRLEFK